MYDDNAGYLFEGHLTVDPEPPQPDWLVQSNLLTAAATLFHGESSGGQRGVSNSTEGAVNLIQELVDRLDNIVPEVSLCILRQQCTVTLLTFGRNLYSFSSRKNY